MSDSETESDSEDECDFKDESDFKESSDQVNRLAEKLAIEHLNAILSPKLRKLYNEKKCFTCKQTGHMS